MLHCTHVVADPVAASKKYIAIPSAIAVSPISSSREPMSNGKLWNNARRTAQIAQPLNELPARSRNRESEAPRPIKIFVTLLHAKWGD